MKKMILVRVLTFAILFCMCFHVVSSILVNQSEYDFHAVKNIPKFYNEPDDSLDAVLIGTCTTFMYFLSPLAWNEYGITVYPFACGGMPAFIDKLMIEEARKTQPDALYIVYFTSLGGVPGAINATHWQCDLMPWSINKARMINRLCGDGIPSWTERAEFYFPIIRYHSRWNQLTDRDFQRGQLLRDAPKGGDENMGFLTGWSDQTGQYVVTENREPLNEFEMEYMTELLEYCKNEDVNVLFVNANTPSGSESSMGEVNTALDMCREYGFPVLELKKLNDEVGMDVSKDYMDPGHANVHGAAKMTDYVARYLVSHYDFEDKRGNPAYSSWDETYDNYLDVISPYTLDFEYTDASRDFGLDAPVLSGLESDSEAIMLSWGSVPEADGYQVYRKFGDGAWSPVATIGAGELSYRDDDLTEIGKYTYTVASYRIVDGETYWGDYNYNGISIEIKEI